MGCCITITAINMGGLPIMLILPPILSDPMTGTNRSGIPGINNILNTGRISLKGIPIGASTILASVTTRIFITGTIAARAKDGREVSRVAPLRDPNLRDQDTVLLK